MRGIAFGENNSWQFFTRETDWGAIHQNEILPVFMQTRAMDSWKWKWMAI